MQEMSQNADEGGKGFGIPLTFFSEDNDESDKNKELSSEEKGKIAEKLFHDYLDNLKIPFFFIDQTQESSSGELNDKQIRRPDYIAHTKVGVFYIDVKYRKKLNFGENNETRFYLNQHELISLYNFQNEFHLSVWVAFTDKLDTPEFFYASMSELYEYYKVVSENIYEECFIYIPYTLLYDYFTFDNGFYKKTNQDFYEIEKKYHIEASKKIKSPKAIKWARINSYNK